MRALFCTAVWGESYIDQFINYSLRTQLSPGNLGAFDVNSLFLIITNSASRDRIQGSPFYKALACLTSVECIAQDNILEDAWRGKYWTLARCQNYALRRAADFDVVFFGYADALWSDGSYRAAARRLAEGYDAVFSMGYPVIDSSFKQVVDQLAPSSTGAISMSPRLFARHVYENLHPMARANHWNRAWMSSICSYLMWDVPGQGALTRAFHQHPVALRVRKDIPEFFYPFRTTLDEEYVARLFRSNPKFRVCASSDEVGVCSLAEDSGESYIVGSRRPSNIGDLTHFAEGHAGLLHRELFKHPIRLQIADVVEELWAPAEAEAAEVAEAVLWRLNTPDSVLALEAPAAFAARKWRQRVYRHWHWMKWMATLWAVNHTARAGLGRPSFAVALLSTVRRLPITHFARRMVFRLLGAEWERRLTNVARRIGRQQESGQDHEPGLIYWTLHAWHRLFSRRRRQRS